MRRIVTATNVAFFVFHYYALWVLAATFAAGLVWWAAILTLLGPLLGVVAFVYSIRKPRSTMALLINSLVSAMYLVIWIPMLLRFTQDLTVSVIRVTPSENALVIGKALEETFEPNEIAVLRAMFPTGTVHQGASGFLKSGNTTNRARMLIVVTGPVLKEMRLRIPKARSIVYVQRENGWGTVST
jgi:hypothetical protein